ncbi:TRAP transporter permease [Brucella melitensis]|uniref:TRAP transporter, 4TM/12TM fusion protein n=5 Tax=Brucella melitensis TaxID=29459 RepID=C0RJF9_BRUMB|nr:MULTISPECIES: TRAP transporter permease [Brucella]AAL51978.1 transporter [Brucella melitensis bv. 1 str. 16M]ACO00967.1 TRAP transporter, 4TM/12TM fusion protein [Brucella melitensis ATCC 23457]ADZ87134.1 TRAP transporter, 4TM/12TM fusion protein [Brucella melitensis M5-90]AIJ89314.1 TRAP transporter, 4TM/12TM fusion family protein [Brucella melitensis bv. 1 str. 16M]AIJ96767.1 TRAP transporter, 4TM/12TM fusion family protein [Brucella melitensis bv. 2 str. 63/9]
MTEEQNAKLAPMELDEVKARELEEKFDSEIHFRPLAPVAARIVGTLLIILSLFHYYTAGFGLLPEMIHRGIHLAFVLGLVFLVFPFSRKGYDEPAKPSLLRPLGISVIDWGLAIIAVVAVIHVPLIPLDDLAFRVGNPTSTDVVLGSLLILILLEATRRSVGWPLPIISVLFMLYALYGPSMPGILVHPGATVSQLVDHLYLTTQGIYGIALGVVATYVFHFVLFGVFATRIGLGQLFLDCAAWVAGRFAGGPAKVSIFGSALFGMISGSSVANAVTVGSLTIPAMIRLGYKRHFAAAVESASSTGGQITPPIMGAAAFLMIEFLNLPYTTIILAAIVPAFMHFFGVLMQVHFEAKRTGLRGMTKEEMPDLKEALKRDWPTIIPLVVLIAVLLSGYTPYLAAFWGITLCIAVGLLNPRKRMTIGEVFEGLRDGAKYALAVGAAAATVGIIVGVVTLTGVGFKISYIVTSTAAQLATYFGTISPVSWFAPQTLTLLFTLVMTGMVCILMGCGIPTTANYIIMATIAAPALGLLGVEPIVAHFFVFYYGVLADITPPVALAAYAAAGMAGADPFKTGNTAFRLGLGKVLVPFVFVFSPSLLLVTSNFNWPDFFIAFFGCVIGITALGAALSGFFLVRTKIWENVLLIFAAMLLVAPEIYSSIVGLILLLPVVVRHLVASRRPAY